MLTPTPPDDTATVKISSLWCVDGRPRQQAEPASEPDPPDRDSRPVPRWRRPSEGRSLPRISQDSRDLLADPRWRRARLTARGLWSAWDRVAAWPLSYRLVPFGQRKSAERQARSPGADVRSHTESIQLARSRHLAQPPARARA